ncbi:MAG: DMT family transporter [bacterium]|jgi:drug/metabolite transporter (DMT)-like permease
MKPERPVAVVIPLAIGVVSFAAILIRLCTVPSAVIAAYRLSFASLILLPFFLKRAPGLQLTRRQLGLCALSGLFLSLHFLSWIESLKLTSVASSVVLVTTSPIFASAFAWLVLGEKLTRRTALAIIICFAGSFVIGRGDFNLGAESLKGDIYALMGAAAAGAYFTIGRDLRRGLGHIEYAFLTYSASAVILLAWAFGRGYEMSGFEPANYLWFALLAAGPQVFGHTSLNWALKYLPASRVTIFVLGEPVGSALLAWLFFKEVPGYTLLAGGALILYGVYVALSERRRL